MLSLLFVGLRRRRGEVRRLRVMTALAVLLLSFALIFQDNMNGFTMESNYRSYGSWVFRTVGPVFEGHPYLEASGDIIRASDIFLPEPRQGSARLLVGEEQETEEVAENAEPEPEISVSVDDHSRFCNLSVGYLPPELAEENYIRLYEGRWPERSGEITMELAALQTLGLSFELGQEVTFYLSEPVDYSRFTEEETPTRTLRLYTFILVGTMERYSSRWLSGNELPGAILSKADCENIPMDLTDYTFWSLRPEYRRGDVWNFALELIDSVKSSERYSGEDFAENGAAFYNPFWGNPELYRGITAVLVLLSSSVMAYLMATYLAKRRRYLLRLREIGASSLEVWRLAAAECLVSVVPTAVFALPAAYILSLAAVWAVTAISGLAWFYVFSWGTLFTILGAVAVTLTLAMAAAILIVAGRGISEKRRGISRHKAAALHRTALRREGKRPYLGFGEILRRQRRLHPLSTVLMCLASVLASAVILFCVSEIGYAYLRDNTVRAIFPDFSGYTYYTAEMRYVVPVKTYTNRHRRKFDTETLKISAKTSRLNSSIPDAFFDELAENPGVESFTRDLNDSLRDVGWPGRESDAFFLGYLREYARKTVHTEHELDLESEKAPAFLDELAKSVITIRARENSDYVWHDHTGKAPEGAEYEAFRSGESVIVSIDKSWKTLSRFGRNSGEAVTEDMWESLGHSFEAGDTLTLYGKNGEITVTVAAVTESDSGFMTIESGPGLASRLRELDGASGQWNNFRVTFGALADMENTAKSLSELCARYNVTYSSYTEALRESREELFRTTITYGFFAASMAILLVFVASSAQAERAARLRPEEERLRRLGAEKGRIRRERNADAFFESLRLVPALLLMYAARMIKYLPDFTRDGAGYVSSLLGEILRPETSSPVFIAAVYVFEWMGWIAVLITLLALMLALWAVNRRGASENE